MRTESMREKIFFAKQELDCMRRKIEGICTTLKGKSTEADPSAHLRNNLPVFRVVGEDNQQGEKDHVYEALAEAVEQMRQAVAQLDIALQAGEDTKNDSCEVMKDNG